MKIIIDENYENTRLDKYIRKHYKEVSLGNIFEAIRKGKIKVNGKKSKENYRFVLGDILEVPFGNDNKKVEFQKLGKDKINLIISYIIYEDDDILIINKPSGLVVHKGSDHDYGLVEMLKSYYKNNEITPINRLDKDTSGLILFGKNIKAIRELNEKQRNGEIEKHYYAAVQGVPKEKGFEISSKIKKEMKEDMEKVMISKEGKMSKSKFKLIQKNDKFSLLEVQLITGRTHQIRVQLADKGLPILGDKKYGVRYGKKMYLFSHRLIIKSMDIDINLEIPDRFSKVFIIKP